jgi:hypothetical protein
LADHVYSDARGFSWNEARANALTDFLVARAPALVAAFKADVEKLGFVY